MILMGWRHKAPPANQQDCRRVQIQGRRIKPLRMDDEGHGYPHQRTRRPITTKYVSGDREPTVANRKLTAPNRQPCEKRGQFMESKYEEMARQMKADGVSEEMIARFVAEEVEEDEFRRGKGVTEIEALREWRKIPEQIRKLLLANAFCHNCGTTEFAPGYTLRMRHGRVLIEGRCAECGAEVARLCD